MARARLLLLLSAAAVLAGPVPGKAWDIREDDHFAFLFHRYGDDMDQPAATPERPYWHMDSAVPPAMRWHDRSIEIVDEYGFTVATALPPPPEVAIAVGVEGAAVVPAPLPPLNRAPRRRAIHKVVARRACPPGLPSSSDRPLPAQPPAQTPKTD